jgi:hypothetical protein
MGGNGVETDNWRVATGPFAYRNGNWPIPVGHDGPALRRQFGGTLPTLPTKDYVTLAMHEVYYDTPNYNSSPFTIRDVLDIAALGYEYEKSPSHLEFIATIAEQRKARAARSPLWAD